MVRRGRHDGTPAGGQADTLALTTGKSLERGGALFTLRARRGGIAPGPGRALRLASHLSASGEGARPKDARSCRPPPCAPFWRNPQHDRPDCSRPAVSQAAAQRRLHQYTFGNG